MSYHLTPQLRKRIVKRLKEGASVSQVAREFNVSRPTIYKWLNDYKQAEDKARYGFGTKPAVIERYSRQATKEQEKLVAWAVKQNPAASKYALSDEINLKFPEHSLGPTGVYKILKRMGITLAEQRLAWANAQPDIIPPLVPSFIDRVRYVLEQFVPHLALAPPPRSVYMNVARLLKPFFASLLLVSLFSYGALSWIRIISQATSFSSALGLVFASMALLMGSFFFFYSFKYYITLALVLSFSQTEVDPASPDTNRGPRGRGKGLVSWVLGFANEDRKEARREVSQAVGLTPNLEHIKLKRYPKVSIHIPFYNEKNVVERAIAASTNFDYQGEYEVILCDDSTDDTTQIIQDYILKCSKHHVASSKGKNKSQATSYQLHTTKGKGWELTEAEIRPGVTLKHLHRTSRSGFKGGALRLALKVTDPKVEFVSIFDADFVPYPDTLELFLKYFQATAGSLDFVKRTRNNADSASFSAARKRAEVQRDSADSRIAAVQGYQWHVLNKSENWITRGIRSEYAGSYVIERSGTEIYGGLKMISGAVYMIRRDVLEEVGWETSITEDFQLTLKLYEKGYKVVYTPYIQAPAECVSTLKRLIRQRMRWAEGHSNNIRRMFIRLMFGKWEEVNPKSQILNPKQYQNSNYQNSKRFEHLDLGNSNLFRASNLDISASSKKKWVPSPLTLSEKLEFLYLSPYYLQAFFFLLGTISWLISETVFPARLPFWTSLWGWSLVLTNMLSLPLMNAVGMFLEESEEKDYAGLPSFIALSYIVVPFQAYAALKGFLEKEEGHWFRTPKTGKITDILRRGTFYRFISGILPGRQPAVARQGIATRVQAFGSEVAQARRGLGIPSLNPKPYTLNPYLSLATANNQFNNFTIKKRKGRRWLGRSLISLFLIVSTSLIYFADFIAIGSKLLGASGVFAIGSQQAEVQETAQGDALKSSGDSPNIILTDNREELEEVAASSRDSLEPAITAEEYNPETHPEVFYVPDEHGKYLPYLVTETGNSLFIETKTEEGIQKVGFANHSVDIKLYEKRSGKDYLLKAVSTPVFEYLSDGGEWQEYVPLFPASLSAEEKENYVLVKLETYLLTNGFATPIPSLIELKIGFENNSYVSKFSFYLGNNNHTNRFKWQTRIVQSSKLKVQNCEDSREQCGIARDAYDLRETVEPELEEYFRASLLGTPVGKQQFGNLEIGWSDFVKVQSYNSKLKADLLYCSLFPDYSLLPPQYPLRVEQSKEDNSSTVYFYPEGKQGELEIDPTLSLSTPGSTIQIDVANRYRAIMDTGDTQDYILISDRAQDDSSPDDVVKFYGSSIRDEATWRAFRFDDSRKTTILESNSARVRIRVEGCFDTTGGNACIKDVAGGNDDTIEVVEEYTFTTEGVFVSTKVDYKDGLELASTNWDYAPVFSLAFNDIDNNNIIAYSEEVRYGNGETESYRSTSGAMNGDEDGYYILQATGGYQDVIFGTMNLNGDKVLSNSTNGADAYAIDDVDEAEAIDLYDVYTQTLKGEGQAQFFFQLHDQADLDTPEERKAMFNDLTDPDYLSYTTGDLWDDKPFGDYLFSSGFEGADPNLCNGGDGWTSGTCETGNTAIGDDSSTVYDGIYAAKFTSTGTNDGARVEKNLGKGYSTLYTRFYFRLDYEDLSNYDWLPITYFQDSTAWQTDQLIVRQDSSGNLELMVADTAENYGYGGSKGYIQLDTWYSIECKVYRHDTVGTMDVWLDGNNIINATNLNTGNTNLDWVMFGMMGAESNNNQIFIDNVIVSESYIGTANYNEAEGAYTVDAATSADTNIWWDKDWSKRRKITFDNAAQSTALTDFPVLVKLDSSRIDYSYTQSAGQDLRFVDEDGRTVLKHEIEEFDEIGSDWVWVRAPQIDASSHGDYIWMYYGNESASAPPSSHGEEVWDDGYYKGVWHFNESSGTRSDATSNDNDLADTGTVPACTSDYKIAGCADFESGNSDYLSITDANQTGLDLTGDYTVNFWVNFETDNQNSSFVSKGEVESWVIEWGWISSSYALLAAHYAAGTEFEESNINHDDTNPGTWYMMTVTRTDSTDDISFYLNGAFDVSKTMTKTPAISAHPVEVGYESATGYLDGKLDEIRISTIPRSADWIAAQYLSMSDSFNTYGSEEIYSVWWNKDWSKRRKITFDNSGEGISVFAIDHETGDLSQYDTTVTDSGDLSVTTAAGLAGTDYGMQAVIDDTTAIYAEKNISAPASEMRMRFYIDTNSLTMDTGDYFYMFRVMTSYDYGWSIVNILLRKPATGDYELHLKAIEDDGTNNDVYTGSFDDGEYYVELHLERGAGDGRARLWMNGILEATVSNLDNYDLFTYVDSVLWGAAASMEATTYGTFYLDELVVNDTGAVIGDKDNETLTEFPVLVKLNSSRIDYSNTQSAGQDLRFVDSDNQTLLNHEIEEWNESGNSFVWVNAPQIDGSSDDDYIWMYYGNTSVSSGQVPEETWDDNFMMVQHLQESTTGATDFKDSTDNNNDSTAVTIDGAGSDPDATGKISGAVEFDGSDDVIDIDDSVSLSPTSELTVEAWFYPTKDTAVQYPVYKFQAYELSYDDSAYGSNEDFGGSVWHDDATTRIRTNDDSYAKNNWYYIVMTGKNDDLIELFVDGISYDTTSFSGYTINDSLSKLTIGDYQDGGYAFDGIIDEVRVSSEERTADWIAAQYDAMSDNFNTFGSEEDSSIADYAPAASQTVASIVSFDMDGGSNTSTLLNGVVTARATSITVDSTTGFPDGAGSATYYAYIEGDKFSYTDTTSTTFTGIPSTGELSVIGHADNSVVSLMARHKPYVKVRGWRDSQKPTNVTLEGTTLYPGTSEYEAENYNASLKPFSDAYFAQDLLWHSTLESLSADVGTTPTNGPYGSCTFTAGRYGKGALCDAEDELMRFAMTDNVDDTTGTIEFWYKDTETPAPYGDFFSSSEGLHEFELYRGGSDTNIRLNINGDSPDAGIWSGVPNVFDGEWHHIRVTYSIDTGGTDDSFYLYIDGVSQGEQTGNITAAINLTGNNFHLGAGDSGVGVYGMFDEFRIYDTVVGPDSIAKGGDTGDSDEYLADTTNDYTFDFNDDDGSNRGEYLWLGSDSRFTGVNYQLTTQATGSSDDFDWEYWDGDSWAALTVANNLKDSSSFETTTGSFYFSQPADWRPYSVNGSTDLYYIRGHLEGGTLSDFTESVFYTDILLFQYLSNISGIDQTFVLTSAPITQSKGTIQIDVPNRYRAIMETGKTGEYVIFYDRAENDSSPDEILKLTSPWPYEEDTHYKLFWDANRRTTILESSSLRARIRVEGCFDTGAGGSCLQDDDNDGSDDVIEVSQEFTFTTEGVFITTDIDFQDDGLELDTDTFNDTIYLDKFSFNGAVANAHSETVYYGNGETENSTSSNSFLNNNDDGYVVIQGNGNYQDIVIGSLVLDGDKWLSNSSDGADYYNVDLLGGGDETDVYNIFTNPTQTLTGFGRCQYYIQFHSQNDLDTEAEREGMFNDLTNPDILSYGTGGEWDDGSAGSPRGAPAGASPGLEFDGTDDYVNIPGSTSLNNMTALTMAVWFKPLDSMGGYNDVIIKRAYVQYCMTIYNNELSYYDNNVGRKASGYYLTQDKWVHLAITVLNNDNVRFYVNGSEYSYTGYNTTIPSGSDPLEIGGGGSAQVEMVKGLLDDVRIYNTALSQSEIQETMYKQISPSTPGLVGYWRFNENTGTKAYDETTNNNDGTLTLGPTWTTGYVPDQYNEAEGAYTMEMNTPSHALDFDGGDDLVSVTESSSLRLTSTGTIELWAKADSTDQDTYAGWVAKSSGGSAATISYYLYWNDTANEIRGGISNGTSENIGASEPDTNWHHWAFVWDESYLRLYKDGVSAATPVSQTVNAQPDSSHTVKIGGDSFGSDSGTDDFFDGLLDDVRIWNDARTLTEIQENMNGPLVGNEDNLVGYWKFDEGRGQVAHDASNNGNEGVLGANFAVGTDDPTWADGYVSPNLNMAGFDIDGGSNVSTLINDASVSAGDTSFTVDSTTGFPDGGGTTTYYAYIEGDKFSYTDVDGTQFTGIPATGEFSIIGHADNSVVSLMNRHKPFYKIRNYRDPAAPSAITLEGSTLASGTDYNTDIKPYSDAYFAQDVLWHSTLEDSSAVTSPDVGSAGSVTGLDPEEFVTAKYGKGMEVTMDNEYISFPLDGNFNGQTGTIEFWYRETTDATGYEAFFDTTEGVAQFALNRRASDSYLRLDVNSTCDVDWTSASINVFNGEWHHIRVTYNTDGGTGTGHDNDSYHLYIDSVDQGERTNDCNNIDIGEYSLIVGMIAGGTNNIGGIIDEFRVYDTVVGPDPVARGGDTADSDEYLADSENDYTFDFNDDDSSNRGEYVWIGSDSQFQGVNVDLATEGVDNGGLFTSDFEGADSNLCDGGDGWDGGSCNPANTLVGNEVNTVYGGTYAMKATTDTDYEARVYENLGSSYNTLYTRMYFRLDYDGLSDWDWLMIAEIEDSSWNTAAVLYIRQVNSNTFELFTGDTASNYTYAGSDGYINLDTWHSIEWKVYSHASSGTQDVWLDGVNVLSATSQNTGGGDLQIPFVGLGYADANGNQAFYDNVVVWDGTMDYEWQYWDGDSWASLTIAGVHGLRTEAFLDDGNFFFDAPSDWRPYSVNGSTDLYYIRGHLEGGTYSTDPVEDTIKTDILLLQYLSNITSEDQTLVVVPEYLWLFFGFGPFLPLTLKKRRKKKKENVFF